MSNLISKRGIAQKKINNISIRVFSACKLVAGMVCSVAVAQDGGETKIANGESDPIKVDYNPMFIHGSEVDVSRFSEGNRIEPGVYSIFIVVNKTHRIKYDVTFKNSKDNPNSQPYFTLQDLKNLGIKLNSENKLHLQTDEKQQDASFTLKSIIEDSSVHYNAGDYELNITVPQINIIYRPRGYIDPSTWDAGVPAIFLDYNANMYRSYTGSKYGTRSNNIVYTGNIGMQTGFNAKGWRFRKRLNLGMSSRGSSHTQNLFGFAQTDIIRLQSSLTIGDSNTRGDIFDSYNIRGIILQSDERMLPEGLRNYVPVLRGVAETNAKVTITQRGQTVYQTVVPPGPFELTDVGAMGYGGDLEMTVTEADGRVRSQSIPFSAPPMLLHQGVSLFSVNAGELREDKLRTKPKVMQGVYQYGVGNMYTLYGGGQFAQRFYSMALGNAFNTPIGGLSLDVTHAKSQLSENKNKTGNSFRVGFSRYLETTNTDLTLAAYKYSTAGYYTFREASLERYAHSTNQESDYRAKQRLTLTIGQRLWNDAYLNFTGSMYQYWDNRPGTRQYSLTYNKSERYFSYSLTGMRTMNSNRRNENTYMLSFNIPLGQSISSQPVFNSIYTTLTHDEGGGSSLQVNANGSQGEMNELNYGIGTTTTKNHNEGTKETVSGNAFYRSPVGNLGLTASADNKSTNQVSFSANGSVIGHQGGITAGPPIGDSPFAIINAPGGRGAKILNGYGSKVDSNGYAIMPSLTAYRENTVSIDTRGLPATVDVLESESTVVPRAGSAILVNMKTIVGTPYILIVKRSDNSYLPIGTELFNENGVSQGIIGQSGMAFIRGWDPTINTLNAKWDEGRSVCRILPNKKWIAPSDKGNNQIVTMEVKCII